MLRAWAERPPAACLAAARPARRRQGHARLPLRPPAPGRRRPRARRRRPGPSGLPHGRHKAHPDLRVLERDAQPEDRQAPGTSWSSRCAPPTRRCTPPPRGTGARCCWSTRRTSSTPSGANALLKLLEEPPPSTVMLLVCQRPGILPRTILSRCMQLPLAPLPEAELVTGLARLAPEIPPERRAVLAGRGRGLARPRAGAGGRRLARTLCGAAAQARRGPHQLAARLDLAAELAEAATAAAFARPPTCSAVPSAASPRCKAGSMPALELFPGERELLRPARRGPRA